MSKDPITCRICQASQGLKRYTVREMMYGLGRDFDYFECTVCGCLQIGCVPPDMSEYYPADYYSYMPFRPRRLEGAKGRFRLFRYDCSVNRRGPLRKTVHALFGQHQYDLLHSLGLDKQSRVVDVGAGNGSFLYPLYELGYHRIQGIDPFVDLDMHYKSGLRVEKKTLDKLDGEWDVIRYSHVFEHIADPAAELAEVKKKLAADGACLISIPTTSSHAWRHYGVHWYQIDAPRHFYLHSLDSLKRLAEGAGLVVDHVIYDSTYKQFYLSELNRQGIPIVKAPKLKGPTGRLTKWRDGRRAARLNRARQGDQFTAILRHA